MPHATKQITYVPESGEKPASWWRWLQKRVAQYAGGEMHLRLSKPKRTHSQNAYLWAIYTTIRDAAHAAGMERINLARTETGSIIALHVTKDTIHLLMKGAYLPEGVTSTTQLDTTQMHDYIERIRQDEWVRALGCYIMTPEEYKASQRGRHA